MAISAVGTFASIDGNGTKTLGLTTVNVGDAVMVATLLLSTGNSVATMTGGNAGGWARVAGPYVSAAVGGTLEIWKGVTTSTGAGTITITLATTNASLYTQIDAKQFTAGAGTTWAVDGTQQAGTNNASSTTLTYPTLVAAGAGELYFAHGIGATSAPSAGATSGFTYVADAATDQIIYNPSVSGTVSPTAAFGSASASGAVAVLITATAATPPTAAAALGALTATATGIRTLSGTAAATMSALTATAAGTRTVSGAGTAPAGALTASATAVVAVDATAIASLGALSATATATAPGGPATIRELVGGSAYNSTTSTVDLVTGGDTAVDDLIVVFHGVDYSAFAVGAVEQVLPEPTGTITDWTPETSPTQLTDNATGAHLTIWSARVTTPGAQTITLGINGSDSGVHGHAYVIANADGVGDAAVVLGPTASTSADTPSVDAGTDTELLLAAWQSNYPNSGGFTPPGSMTDAATSPVADSAQQTTAREQLDAPGATGVRTATQGSATNYASAAVTVRALGATPATADAGLGALTATATAVVEHAAAAAATLGGLSATAVGTRLVGASAAAPLGGFTATATAVVQHPATAAATLGALTASAAAVPTVLGVAVAGPSVELDFPSDDGYPADDLYPGEGIPLGLGTLTASATGTVTGPEVSGVAAASLGALTATATGDVTAEVITATAAASLGALTATATAVRTLSGVLAASLGALTATATGTVTAEQIDATATAALGALTASVVGVVTVEATATADLEGLTATAIGSAFAAGDGVADAQLGALTATAVGLRTTGGTAAAALGNLTAAATADVTVHATASAALGGLTATGVASRELTATASASFGPLTSAGIAVVEIIGIAEAMFGNLDATANGARVATATATADLGEFLATADGVTTTPIDGRTLHAGTPQRLPGIHAGEPQLA